MKDLITPVIQASAEKCPPEVKLVLVKVVAPALEAFEEICLQNIDISTVVEEARGINNEGKFLVRFLWEWNRGNREGRMDISVYYKESLQVLVGLGDVLGTRQLSADLTNTIASLAALKELLQTLEPQMWTPEQNNNFIGTKFCTVVIGKGGIHVTRIWGRKPGQ